MNTLVLLLATAGAPAAQPVESMTPTSVPSGYQAGMTEQPQDSRPRFFSRIRGFFSRRPSGSDAAPQDSFPGYQGGMGGTGAFQASPYGAGAYQGGTYGAGAYQGGMYGAGGYQTYGTRSPSVTITGVSPAPMATPRISPVPSGSPVVGPEGVAPPVATTPSRGTPSGDPF
jgi:hypothetical protein